MQKSCDVLLFVMMNCMENSVVVKTWMTESYQVSQSLADIVKERSLAQVAWCNLSSFCIEFLRQAFHMFMSKDPKCKLLPTCLNVLGMSHGQKCATQAKTFNLRSQDLDFERSRHLSQASILSMQGSYRRSSQDLRVRAMQRVFGQPLLQALNFPPIRSRQASTCPFLMGQKLAMQEAILFADKLYM